MIKLTDILTESTPKGWEKTVKKMKKHKDKIDNPWALAYYMKKKGYKPSTEELDPVGKEDDDVNNDGKVDSTDQYLLHRRKAIATAMKNEEDTQPEVDFEGKMAKAQLVRIIKQSKELFDMLKDDEQLEAWVQSKLTKAADYVDGVYHHLDYELNKDKDSLEKDLEPPTEPSAKSSTSTKKKAPSKKKSGERDYKREYEQYHGTPEQRERRSARNKARRKMENKGKVKKGDGKDVHHKNRNTKDNSAKNLAVISKSKNRSMNGHGE